MATPATGFRAFVIVWSGQFLSLVGGALTAFALGVYVYNLTGSATTLGAILVLGLLPTILASPFAGSLVDRWGPKLALLVSNAGNVLITLVLALVLITDTFAVWHVYLIVSVGALLGAVEMPALASLTPQLVSKDQLGRANGMRMAAVAASQVLAPVTAGFLLLAVGIEGIVLLDLFSFGLAIVTLLVVHVPRPAPEDAGTDLDGRPRSLLAEFWVGWRYIVARRGLLALLIFLSAVNFSAGVIELVLTPLVLNFASADGLGTVMSIGGVGMIAASVAVSVWGGPKRRVRGILGFSLVLGLATVLGATRPSVALVAAAAFLFMGALGVIIATQQTIWQTKVETRLLGRVGAILGMVAAIPQLIAYGLAGVLVDHVFDPLVGPDEVRPGVLTTLIGHGPGRGAALLMMLMGALIAVTVGVAALSPRLVRLEDELPDVDSDPDMDSDPDVDSDPDSDSPVDSAGGRAVPVKGAVTDAPDPADSLDRSRSGSVI